MSKSFGYEAHDPNIRRGTGKFSFHNGDTYEGNYKLHLTKTILVKDGEGVYKTDDFNTYSGKWEEDNFGSREFVIRHNNGGQYKGSINVEGQMDGEGIYTFPDDSSIHAIWSQNKPTSKILYVEPRGHVWVVESTSNDSISFIPSNHFWKEVCQETASDVSATSLPTLSTETFVNR